MTLRPAGHDLLVCTQLHPTCSTFAVRLSIAGPLRDAGLAQPTDVQHTVVVHALELWEPVGDAVAARTEAVMMGVLYTLEGKV